MNMLDEDHGQLPLLVGFSVPRTGDDTLPGHYDAEQEVWVIDGYDGARPIVEAAESLAELVTKTKVRPERDDVAEPSLMALLQLVTKTYVRQERDD